MNSNPNRHRQARRLPPLPGRSLAEHIRAGWRFLLRRLVQVPGQSAPVASGTPETLAVGLRPLRQHPQLLPLILVGLTLGGSALGGIATGGSALGESDPPAGIPAGKSVTPASSGAPDKHLQSPRKGTFVFQVKLVGDVEALKQHYLSPGFSSKLASLVDDGKVVKAGAVVARLDSKTVEEDLDEQLAELDVARSNLIEQERTAAADKVRLDAEIQRAQAEVAQKQLALNLLLQGTRPEELSKRQLQQELAQKALELARSTLELKQRLAVKGISTQLEILQAKLDLVNKERDLHVATAELEQARIGATPLTRELARLDLSKAQRQLAWAVQNRALNTEQAALTHQNLVAKQTNSSNRVAQLRGQLKQAVMRAPLAGTVVLSKTWTNEGLKRPAVGDDVEEGNPFLSVADLSVVRIRTELDETLLREARIGMPCSIQLPSLRGRRFSGKISHIGVLAHERTGRQNTQGLSKVFDLEILPDTQETVFQPGTSVDIELPFRQQANVLLLPREAVWHKGQGYYVLLADGSQRAVTLGEVNDKDVVILTGLTVADQVQMPETPAAHDGNTGGKS